MSDDRVRRISFIGWKSGYLRPIFYEGITAEIADEFHHTLMVAENSASQYGHTTAVTVPAGIRILKHDE